jgi:hypothetical protein
MHAEPQSETNAQPTEDLGVLPPAPSIVHIGQLIEDWKHTIYVHDHVDGRWQTLSLADLDQEAPLRGAYWRGALTERYRLGGALPLRGPEGPAADAVIGQG